MFVSNAAASAAQLVTSSVTREYHHDFKFDPDYVPCIFDFTFYLSH